MSNGLVRKNHRQQTLLRLVAERRLATQRDVARALRGAGFPATQATVSRDIEELGLVKVTREGAHVYAPPSAVGGPAGGGERLRRFCEDYPVEGARADSLVVLRSLPGSAMTLAAAFDAVGFADVVGTIAGDDTVFAATPSAREARGLLERLRGFGVRSVQSARMAAKHGSAAKKTAGRGP